MQKPVKVAHGSQIIACLILFLGKKQNKCTEDNALELSRLEKVMTINYLNVKIICIQSWKISPCFGISLISFQGPQNALHEIEVGFSVLV